MIYRFGEFALDRERLELRRGGQLLDLQPQVFGVLATLIERRDGVVAKDELLEAVWDGRVISDAAIHSRIHAARQAVGDTGHGQSFIRTYRGRGFRFVASVKEDQASGRSDAVEAGRSQSWPERQQIRFCTAPDRVRLAYACTGDGPLMVKAATWLTHVELDFESPVWNPWIRELSARNTFLRYDQRGNGLSDREVDDISFAAWVGDLETVVDAAGADRFALMGVSQSCKVAIAYAVRHPHRVSHLVLYGGAAGATARQGPEAVERENAVQTLLRLGWGTETHPFSETIARRLMADGRPDQIRWWTDLQRITASSETAVRIRQMHSIADVVDLLPQVAVPTLVIHRRGDTAVPFEAGRQMAADIPGARFVPLAGRNHIIIESEDEWPKFVDEVQRFVGV